MKRRLLTFGLLILVSVPAGLADAPQSLCQAPAPPASKQPNFFSEQQENDLGDAVAERTDRDVRIIDHDELAATLRRIGDRLVRHLPSTHLNIRFSLVDLPEANAFVLPGGRVYVSRKLVGFTRDEDELAGVLGHELGHLIARQQTLRFTQLLRDVIGVTAVGDRQDIFDKYNKLMDNAARKPRAFDNHEGREDGDQLQADAIGLYVVAAAGYDPQAHVRLFDRFAETKGRTGGFFSNLFGTTSAESKRLRGLIKGAAALPPACIDARASSDPTAYQQWQATVIGYAGPARKEMLHNVVSRTSLDPPLRGEVEHVRFSPDGRFLLAQDDSGITVLSREPLQPKFHIDAPDADAPQFTPDSASVVFNTTGLRVERWSVATQRLVEVHELVMRAGCLQTRLSPDGAALACLDGTFNLNLIEVASGAVVFQQKKFYTDDYGLGLFGALFGRSGLVNLGFSSDARYFAASYRIPGMPGLAGGRDAAVIYDRHTKSSPVLKFDVKRMLAGGFVFTGPALLVAHNDADDAKSVQIALPKAEILGPLKLFGGAMTAATSGNYVMIRPFQKYAVGLMDLGKGVVIKGNPGRALDVHDRVFAAERISGELALYSMTDNTVLASAPLPRGTLRSLDASAVSPDLKWLAVSSRTRGAVWDLSNGSRLMHIRGFRGAFFDDGGQLFADFPRTTDETRKLGRIDLQQRLVAGAREIKDDDAFQAGPSLIVRAPTAKGDAVTIEARSVHDGRALWTKTFASEAPQTFPSDRYGTMVLAWPASARTVRDEARKNPALARQLSDLKNVAGDYFLQVIDLHTGAAKGALLIETGDASFDVRSVIAADDWVVIEDGGNRVLVYRLSSGELKGHVFGDRAALAPGSGLLKVGNGEGKVTLYDLATMQRRDDFTFVHGVSLTRFSADGTKFFVVTDDQTAFVIDLSKGGT